MNKYTYIIWSGLLLFAIMFNGCKRGVSLSETDFKDMYSSKSDVPQPRFKVFHPSDIKTTIYFMFENRGLKYSVDSKSEDIKSEVRIAWQLYNDYTSTEVIDSSSFLMSDTIATTGFFQLQGEFSLDLQSGNDYVVKVTTTDINSSQKTVSFISINKTDKTNRQFFLVKLRENNSVLFRNFFYANEELEILYSPNKSISQLKGKYFSQVFPISPPPFSMSSAQPFDFDDHTTFNLDLTDGIGFFSANKSGIYHLGLENGNKYSGLTLFQYNDDFPEVNTPEEMLSPLRFITSKKEFGKLKKYQSTKKAVDEFWLNTSHDPKKSKKLIKGYYNRVQNANYFFTSFKEGWKTDRGVIYIVFGPPSIVYRSLTGESWTYGEESDYRSLTFNFAKINNPFTNNDYTLQRTSMYKSPWYRAVDAWRQGKVTSLEY